MPDSPQVQVWTRSLPSREHPERNEDQYWSAQNGIAHAVIDGMGGARRVVDGKEIGGEHAAGELRAVLEERLENLPANLGLSDARQLLTAVVAEAGERIFRKVNANGEIPPEQIPPGSTISDVSAGAVMTAMILCEGGRRAVIGQNGDTRAYLYSDGELLLLTEDQDAVMLDVLNGVLSEEQAEAMQREMDGFDGRNVSMLSRETRQYFLKRNLLFGQIGDSAAPRPPEFVTIQLRPGDMLALVSDGVYANLTSDEIRAGLASADPAAALVVRAEAFSAIRTLPDPNDPSVPYNYRAHKDDATAVIVRVDW